MTEDTWVDRYYEALAFFYWEPQHLGRKKAERSSILSLKSAMEHLRSMEVTLNHIINQFLSLAPASFRNKLFEKALGVPMTGQYALAGERFRSDRQPWDKCQPDFLFMDESGTRTVSLEMKIDSQSDVDQVLKYAALALAVEQQPGLREMQHSLVYLGKGSFSSLWPRAVGVNTVEELKAAIKKEQDTFFDQRLKKAENLNPRFGHIVSELAVGYLNYIEFAELLRLERGSESASGNDQVYANLIDGMVKELEDRELVPGRNLGPDWAVEIRAGSFVIEPP